VAAALLGRYSDWEVLRAALENPAPEVRELALSHLREFAAEGDPFSQAVLEGRAVP
jgi:HEAT repeat protein